MRLPKAVRRNSKRSRPCGDTAAEHDVLGDGRGYRASHDDASSIVLHIKSLIRSPKRDRVILRRSLRVIVLACGGLGALFASLSLGPTDANGGVHPER